ncbi:GNAT family N-acetyltransferase [Streptomyces sp. CMB-StM0423]|uniref:GNAT family N-acetyltransferase n=1 Tax=Streptomyces sp. CMB-StM0423 TaxID=2059884 RepID=UPI000C70D286|nr:GNAT family N-acetyltransferase [Streptomyces sp. CMB-StM0423]AUH44914.1 GNAT family N-acetyltransferase [Streptomyces sp. CMB-StM0423]
MIETERLVLRPLTTEDVDAFVALHADERVNRFVGAYTPEQARARLATIERQWAERGHGLCAVELKSSGEFIGRVGLNYWEELDEVELGWTLAAESWGHGYATEAAGACLEWGFATLEEEYFISLIRPANTASARVAERLGFEPRREETFMGHGVTVWVRERPVAG